MPSLCGGFHECLICTAGRGCLAGNGDDDFGFIGMDAVKEKLRTKKYGPDKSDSRDLNEKEIAFLESIVKNGYQRMGWTKI